ncbi:hypothetical protein D9756_007805 [Leucocoprinus leucothites]|uniref:Uncharacterized protein n=1 Tax=Leucocoprinus leucothites TaxID=201217 RepID=A0A8H5D560_9AGAR|nr:hypothetical protein D9756_007805 [Leucoagaricus leucothites]
MADQELGDQLPPNVAQFCKLFPPSTRLCRIVNRLTGTFLDVRPTLDLAIDAVPRVVCEILAFFAASSVNNANLVNPENVGVQYWLIAPYNNGQALIPVPRDGSQVVRYLTASSVKTNVAATLSPFPTSWILLPTSRCPNTTPLNAYSVIKGVYEQWTCMINWPHFMDRALLTSDGPGWAPDQGTQIHTCNSEDSGWYWNIQFTRYQRMESIPPVLLPTYPPNIIVPGHHALLEVQEQEVKH